MGHVASRDHSIVAKVLATLSGEIVGRAALLGLNFYVANRLGVALYGEMGLFIAAASMLQPLADLGLSHLALRNIAQDGGSGRFPLFLGVKLVGSAAFLCLIAAWSILSHGTLASPGAMLAGILVLVTTWSDFLRQILRALHLEALEFRMRTAFVLGSVGGAMIVAFAPASSGLALLALSLPPLLLCFGYSSALMKILPMRATLRGSWNFLLDHRELLLGSMGYLFLVAAIMRLDVWMANHFLGKEATGAWLSAYNLVYAGAFLAQGLASIALPRLVGDDRPGRVILWKVWRLQIALASALALGVAIAGPFVFGVIYRAPGFAQAAPVLPLLGLLLANSTLAVLAYHLFLAANRIWTYLALMVPAITLKFLLALWLVPEYGIKGMAITNLLSEGAFCAATIWLGCRAYLDWRRNTAV